MLKKYGMKEARKLLKDLFDEWLASLNDTPPPQVIEDLLTSYFVPFCVTDEVSVPSLRWPKGPVQSCFDQSSYNLYSLWAGVLPKPYQKSGLCRPVCLSALDGIVDTFIQPCGFLSGNGYVYVEALVELFKQCPVIQVKASSANPSVPEMNGTTAMSGSNTGSTTPTSGNSSSTSGNSTLTSSRQPESQVTMTSPPTFSGAVPTAPPSTRSNACTPWTSVQAATVTAATALAVGLA